MKIAIGLSLMVVLMFFPLACTSVPERQSNPTAVSTTAGMEGEEMSTRLPHEKYAEYEIVTLLPRDAIRAIDEPRFLTVSKADVVYDPTELVLGVEFNGAARAYSVPLLSQHEIVNDTVGGVKIAITW